MDRTDPTSASGYGTNPCRPAPIWTQARKFREQIACWFFGEPADLISPIDPRDMLI
jgi:hypothetical protein